VGVGGAARKSLIIKHLRVKLFLKFFRVKQKVFQKKSLFSVSCFDSLKDMKNNKKKIRVRVDWNTGSRIELPVKGKGAYSRKNKHKKNFDTNEEL